MNAEKQKKEVAALIGQIRRIVLNKPILKQHMTDSEEFAGLQEAISYLSQCLSECNAFLHHLSNGELETDPPGRHNFVAGELKELHAGLKHLTWQANQVAAGDYSQTVSFMGDFSTAFNQMVKQLSEREHQLKEQSRISNNTSALLVAVMDNLKEWIVVTDKETGKILYTNQSANQFYYDLKKGRHICGENCRLKSMLSEQDRIAAETSEFEFKCPLHHTVFYVKAFAIKWNDVLACAHYISDITDQKETQEEMESLAYSDELTGAFNRRYCEQLITQLLEDQKSFCFCLIDLDGLKYANDHYGHTAGDVYIKTVTNAIESETRVSDILCRLGGDEFCVIFEDCGPDVVEKKMGNINAKLAQLSDEYAMSISYGITAVDETFAESMETLLMDTDAKMYEHKNKKRNIHKH